MRPRQEKSARSSSDEVAGACWTLSLTLQPSNPRITTMAAVSERFVGSTVLNCMDSFCASIESMWRGGEGEGGEG